MRRYVACPMQAGAALGAVVAVDPPGGAVKVRTPEGSQSGRELRVRGKGIPSEPAGAG
jgi:curved DNA-binding protein